jgi:hypothetical protein
MEVNGLQPLLIMNRLQLVFYQRIGVTANQTVCLYKIVSLLDTHKSMSQKTYHIINLDVDTWVSHVISVQLSANAELLMQKPPIFSVCTQEKQFGFIKSSIVVGKSCYKWETSDTSMLCSGKFQVVTDCCSTDFVHVIEISCF